MPVAETPERFVRLSDLCTPSMGANEWGASPLYVNLSTPTVDQILAKGNCVTARKRGEEAHGQDCEPTNRNVLSGRRRG